jgi:hypothetical protein
MSPSAPSRLPPAERASISGLTRQERLVLRSRLRSIKNFTLGFLGVELKPYQLQAAEAVVRSVFARDGESFVVIFARQSGKDEMIASLILFLLARLGPVGGNIICAQPTFNPQTANAMQRLEQRAFQRPFFREAHLRKLHGHIYEHALARVTYLSAGPTANVVGLTADRLLIINEAQDVARNIYDQRFAPMAASGNATRLFSGTAWTAGTLLEREKRLALQRQEKDGLQRVFIVDGPQAARHNPQYGRFLKNEVAKLGRDHPMIRTQYFCENVDARSAMFTPAHRLLMRGDVLPALINDPSLPAFSPGSVRCAFLVDVAGQEESSTSAVRSDFGGGVEAELNLTRDAITLRIVEIDLSTMETLQAPTYRVVHTAQWTGLNHLNVFGQLKSLGETWRPEKIVIDATGVGEGIWAMLDRAFPTRVIPVKFTQQVKSDLAYGFLAIINSGRFKDCVPSAETDRQYAACEADVLVGPAKTMRWGVPAGRRDEQGRPVHDDIPVTDSLAAILDKLKWHIHSPTFMIFAPDPLLDMDTNY